MEATDSIAVELVKETEVCPCVSCGTGPTKDVCKVREAPFSFAGSRSLLGVNFVHRDLRYPSCERVILRR